VESIPSFLAGLEVKEKRNEKVRVCPFASTASTPRVIFRFFFRFMINLKGVDRVNG
jgi:hypothetical protein